MTHPRSPQKGRRTRAARPATSPLSCERLEKRTLLSGGLGEGATTLKVEVSNAALVQELIGQGAGW